MNDAPHATVTLEPARAVREALRMAAAGYQLVPVTITRRSDGKKGAKFHENWRHEHAWSADPERIRDWSAQHACSFAVRTGPAGGVDVVDLDGEEGVAWWAAQGYPLGSMVVDTISGGMHLYVPACGLPTVSKQFGPSVDTRGEGGLVFAPGSFVVGEEATYRIRDELVGPRGLNPLPVELVAEILASRPEVTDHPADGRITVHDREWMIQRTRAAVEKVAEMPLHTDGSKFRDAQMGAAMMLGRLADAGLCSVDGARSMIEEATLKVWPDGMTEADEKNIDSGLLDGPRKERWRTGDPTSASDSTEGELGATTFETAVAAEVNRLKVSEAAKRQLAEERNAARPRIADGLIDDLDAIPAPEMLLGSLIPESSIGFIGGKSGAYKTFLATSWACCIATGRPWLDRPEFAVRRPLKVLYVAAEGMRGAGARLRSWEVANNTSRRGRLTLYPRPIHLGDPAQLDELAAVVEQHGYEFLVIDTYHRSAPTADENSTKDFGVIFEAAARLRDDYGCGVLFVDHTGHAGERLRGTSGKGDDADYVLISTYSGTDRAVDVQRELQVFKLKDEDSSDRWLIHLQPVDGQSMPVVEIGTAQIVNPFKSTGEWWQADQAIEIPPAIIQKIENEAAKAEGRGLEAARWVWRYLAFMDDEQGLTRGQIKQALMAIPRAEPFTPAGVDKAIPLLDKAGVVGRDKTRIWLEP